MTKKFRERFHGGKKSPEKAGVKVKRASLRNRVESTMEAITFAEAGVHEVAREIVSEQQKILVVGHGECFSKAVVNYVLGFAERMNHEIVALNVLPVNKTDTRSSPYCGVNPKGDLNDCEQSITTFHRLCMEKGIALTHIVKSGDMEGCVPEVYQEVRRISFVVSEPEVLPKLARDVDLAGIPLLSPAYE
jgi:hypothetical protein